MFSTLTKKRIFIGCLAMGLALIFPNVQASEQSRPINLIVPTPPGSASDALARALSAPWSEASGRPVVVQNVVGAGTTIGTRKIVRSDSDGLTLGIISSNHTINPWLYKKLPYDTLADITPIAMIGSVPAMLVANNSVAANTPAELARLSQSVTEPLTEGVVSGTAYHLVSEVFKEQSRVTTNAIPYKGSAQVINDLLGGTLDIAFVAAQAAAPHVTAGKMKGLAVSTGERTNMAPDVPTLREAGLTEFNVDVWIAIVGPAGLSESDIATRRKEIDIALADPKMKEALQHQGIQAISMAQPDILPFLKAELARNQDLVRRMGFSIN